MSGRNVIVATVPVYQYPRQGLTAISQTTLTTPEDEVFFPLRYYVHTITLQMLSVQDMF